MFIDQSRDLWIRGVYSKAAAVKLASMVDCAVWHDTAGMLAFIGDHKLVSPRCIYLSNICALVYMLSPATCI